MPISPEKRALYPANWKTEIRPRILARAGNCCEQCGVPNRAIGWRNDDGKFNVVELDGDMKRVAELQHDYGDVFRLVLIVLTIAHVYDESPSNCADDNLAAWCQRCHNNHDRPMRMKNAAATRRAKSATSDLFAGSAGA